MNPCHCLYSLLFEALLCICIYILQTCFGFSGDVRHIVLFYIVICLHVVASHEALGLLDDELEPIQSSSSRLVALEHHSSGNI